MEAKIAVAVLMGLVGNLTVWAVQEKEAENKAPQQQEQDPQKQIQKCIEGLNADEWKTRVQSEEELIKIGKPALEALHKAFETGDLEVKTRAQEAMEQIEFGKGVEKLEKLAKKQNAENGRVDEIKAEELNKYFPDYHFYHLFNGQFNGFGQGIGQVQIIGAGGRIIRNGGGAKGDSDAYNDGAGQGIYALKRLENTPQELSKGSVLSKIALESGVKLSSEEDVRNFVKVCEENLDMKSAYAQWQGLGQQKEDSEEKVEKNDKGWKYRKGAIEWNFETDKDGKVQNIKRAFSRGTGKGGVGDAGEGIQQKGIQIQRIGGNQAQFQLQIQVEGPKKNDEEIKKEKVEDKKDSEAKQQEEQEKK